MPLKTIGVIVLKPGSGSRRGLLRVGDGIADFHLGGRLDVGDEIADLAGLQRLGADLLRA